jgi:type IV pilus assembly protein PilN
MIRINLLPPEERKRRAPIPTKLILGGFGVILVFVGMGYGWYWLSGEVAGVRKKIQDTQAELKRYEELAKQVDKAQAEKKRLEEKIKVIEKLVAAQGGPVQLLDEISKAVPNDVWVTALTRTGKKLEISGIAFSNFSVANFMTNLGKASDLLANVDLVVAEKATVEQAPVERFTITAEVKEKEKKG